MEARIPSFPGRRGVRILIFQRARLDRGSICAYTSLCDFLHVYMTAMLGGTGVPDCPLMRLSVRYQRVWRYEGFYTMERLFFLPF